MKEYDYLIIGGGMAAAAAANAIREEEKEGSLGLISAEEREPYDRPPLSKDLWTGDASLDDIWRHLPARLDFYHGHRAVALDREARTVGDDRGEQYRYNKLLLATGGTPRHLPFGDGNILYFRGVDDYRQLHRLAAEKERFAIIGGGFIGSELAAALAMNGCQVTMLFPEDGICGLIFPPDLADFLNGYFRDRGVDVRPGASVTGVSKEGDDSLLTVRTEDSNTLEVDAVVAGIGITPNTTLAEKAGLDVDNGIVVDERLRSSDPHIYAAGDVANYYDEGLQMRRRVEHENAANTMGRTAGRNMAGAGLTYDLTPMFYSDLFDLGYEAVGQLSSDLETTVAWQEPFKKGIVYYHEGDRLRGVLLWKVWDSVDKARALLASDEPFDPDEAAAAL
jgi:NADPH-dependent 2,4-dienoyl-CoA reductase/sulfur reductase-like enzyme